MRHPSRLAAALIATGLFAAVGAAPAAAAEKVRISAFQGAFVNFPVYVAKDLKIFEKHGVEPELIFCARIWSGLKDEVRTFG